MTIQRPFIIKTTKLVKKYNEKRRLESLEYETNETEIYAFNLKEALESFEKYKLSDNEMILSIKLRNEGIYNEI